MAQIEVEGLHKAFVVAKRPAGRFGALRGLIRPQHERIVAVEALDFRVAAGELVGFLGPNGAGKSTTIKMLTGVLTPTAGRITAAGFTPHLARRRYSTQIGVVFGHRSQLIYDLPPRDSFDLLKAMYQIAPALYRERLARFAAVLDAETLLDRPVRTLSLGQRMRCELIAALLHGPKLLFLDEPTIGLDVTAKDRIRDFIAEINRQDGVTVLLTTHDLADLERLCRRLLLIDRGKLLFDGPLEQMRARLGRERRLQASFASEAEARQAVASLRGRPELTLSREGRLVTVGFARERVATPEVVRLIGAGAEPLDLTIVDEGIEAIIRRAFAGGLAAERTGA